MWTFNHLSIIKDLVEFHVKQSQHVSRSMFDKSINRWRTSFIFYLCGIFVIFVIIITPSESSAHPEVRV